MHCHMKSTLTAVAHVLYSLILSVEAELLDSVENSQLVYFRYFCNLLHVLCLQYMVHCSATHHS
jgi:hypothetical protein